MVRKDRSRSICAKALGSTTRPMKSGGAFDLVTRETQLTGPERLEWLKSDGYLYDTIQPNGANQRPSIVATYDYVDEGGALLSQVCRFEPKDFRQRRPDGNGGWVWSVKGVRHVPYHLPQILETDDKVIVIVEGEKAADKLWKIGIPATCSLRRCRGNGAMS